MEKVGVPAETMAELYELLDYEHGATLAEESEEVDGFRTVASVYIGDSRWMKRYHLIIRRVEDSQLFACEYQLGLTEEQPHEYPWEDGKPVECWPVRAETRVITKTVTRYIGM